MEPNQKGISAEVIVAVVVLGILAVMVVPLPPALLDMLLGVSVAVSVLMLLVALGLTRAVEFSVFPSLLLLVTLFRLALNIATTRLVLLSGADGAGSAGHIVEAFGRFAVGGSLVVGAVVFLILLVVNFTVITKGSGRVSEVAARFTLDALPGKQMSIDAELAAGAIDDREAKSRRTALESEAEFFGAMDGASKFVRGDAVAGLAITAINIVGGLLTGVLMHDLSVGQAVETYVVLTVGDGLVSQLPALLVSTAAGIIVTRAAGSDLGTQVSTQLFANPRVLQATAAVLALLGLLPGMPVLPFFGLAAGCFLLSTRAKKKKARAAAEPAKPASAAAPERLQDLLQVDPIEVELGFGLLPLIDLARGGELPGRVTALRRQLATELGVVLPSVHLRDELRLEPSEYRVRVRGLEVAKGAIHVDRLLCLDPTGQTPQVPGIPTQDPTFQLPAVWILASDRPQAEAMGYTLVDPPSVLVTHLSEVLRRNAWDLVGRQETQELLAACAREAPKLVEDTVPAQVSLGELSRVLRSLLREGLSVRDLRTILEAVADAAPRSKEHAFLVEQARRRLARQITARVSDGLTVHALALDRAAEDRLRQSLGAADGEVTLAPDLETARRLLSELESNAAVLTSQGRPVVLLAPPDLRRPVFEFANRFVPDLFVITARELVPGTPIAPAGQLRLDAAARAA